MGSQGNDAGGNAIGSID